MFSTKLGAWIQLRQHETLSYNTTEELLTVGHQQISFCQLSLSLLVCHKGPVPIRGNYRSPSNSDILDSLHGPVVQPWLSRFHRHSFRQSVEFGCPCCAEGTGDAELIVLTKSYYLVFLCLAVWFVEDQFRMQNFWFTS